MPGFEALEIHGPEKLLRGFVAGWGAGRGLAPEELLLRVLWARDWGARIEGWHGALGGGSAHVLLVREDVAAAIGAALASHGGELQLRRRERIAGARFAFEFEIFSRQEAAEVRALFEGPPEGVTLSDYRLREKSEPGAAGLELYSPVHDYVFSGSGLAAGEVGAILALHERTRQHERIRARDVHLELAP